MHRRMALLNYTHGEARSCGRWSPEPPANRWELMLMKNTQKIRTAAGTQANRLAQSKQKSEEHKKKSKLHVLGIHKRTAWRSFPNSTCAVSEPQDMLDPNDGSLVDLAVGQQKRHMQWEHHARARWRHGWANLARDPSAV